MRCAAKGCPWRQTYCLRLYTHPSIDVVDTAHGRGLRASDPSCWEVLLYALAAAQLDGVDAAPSLQLHSRSLRRARIMAIITAARRLQRGWL